MLGQMMGIHQRCIPIALTTKDHPLHERTKPDDIVQQALGVRTVWANQYPRTGKPDFVVEYTLFTPLDQSDTHEKPTGDQANSEDATQPKNMTHKVTLRFLSPDGEPVRIRTLYEDQVGNLVQWGVEIKPHGQQQYRQAYDDEFAALVAHANLLLDQYSDNG